MLEHIFRNINDIRVFDAMTDFVLDKYEKEELDKILDCEELLGHNTNDIVDIDELMEILEYSEYKKIEVEDSLNHLVREKILGVKKVRMEGATGCKLCKYSDKFGFPRLYGHNSHVAEQISIGFINNYYMEDNKLTGLLRNAIFNHVLLTMGSECDGDNL